MPDVFVPTVFQQRQLLKILRLNFPVLEAALTMTGGGRGYQGGLLALRAARRAGLAALGARCRMARDRYLRFASVLRL